MIGRHDNGLTRGDALLWIGMCAVCIVLLVWSFAKYGRNDAKSQAGDAELEVVAPTFALTSQDGARFESAGLSGKVWVADFVFTNCAGPCPIMTLNMKALQDYFGQKRELEFVSFTCDPLRDTPEVLTEYARRVDADLSNWTFLTGAYEEIQRIAGAFLVSVVNENETSEPSREVVADAVPQEGPIIHSTRFLLVDRSGLVVGSFQGTDAAALDLLVAEIERQLAVSEAGYLHVLPAVNASLNALAAMLLVAGLVFVKQGRLRRHKYAMISAFVVSVVFLACYLTYHALRQMAEGMGHTKWEVEGFWRPIYYTILISHVVLAAAVPFLAVRTLWLGLKDRIAVHRKWARVTWPIWMYVSITGVIVYLMLYHLHPALLAS